MAEENTPESGASPKDPELGASEPPPASAEPPVSGTTPTTPTSAVSAVSATGKSVALTPGQRLAAKKAQKAVDKREFKEEIKRTEEEARLKEQEEADRLLGRSTRPEQELPAEVEKAARTFSDFIQDHRGRILGGVALGLAIAAVYFGAERFMRSGAAEQAEQLGRALEIANAPIDADDTDGTTDDGKPVFKTEQDRATKALAAFDQVVKGDKDSTTGVWAKLGAASAEIELGKFEDARKHFQAVYDAHTKEPDLAERALEGVGISYEAESKPDEALKSYEKLKTVEGSKELSDYHVARIKLAKGDREGGKTLLKSLYDQLSAPSTDGTPPSRFLKSEVEVRLAEIDSKLVDKGSSAEGDAPQQFSEEQIQKLLEQLQKKGGAPGAGTE